MASTSSDRKRCPPFSTECSARTVTSWASGWRSRWSRSYRCSRASATCPTSAGGSPLSSPGGGGASCPAAYSKSGVMGSTTDSHSPVSHGCPGMARSWRSQALTQAWGYAILEVAGGKQKTRRSLDCWFSLTGQFLISTGRAVKGKPAKLRLCTVAATPSLSQS